MKISKTSFINYIRCPRYAALEELARDKDDAIVSFTDDLSDLMSNENLAKKNLLLKALKEQNEDADDDDKALEELADAHLEMMMPYYNKLELLSGKAITDRFGGNVIFDADTFKQKRFSYLHDGFELFCFLDGYQEDDKHIRVFETKAGTSSQYNKEFFRMDKEQHPFFVEMPSGIFVPAEDVMEVSNDYYKKETKFLDRLHKLGKYVYDLAYQRFVYERNHITKSKSRNYYLVLLNHEYVYDGRKDDKGHAIYTNDIVKFFDLTSLVNKMDPILSGDLDIVIERLNTMNASAVPLGRHSKDCPFYEICSSHIPKENSLSIYTHSHHGFKEADGTKHDFYDLLNSGIVSALDIPVEYLNRPNNVIQREVLETGKPYYNVDKIRAGIKQIKYPIYHLDFESFNAPLPRYVGESPYTQSVFQYSIHIEREEGVSDFDNDHYEYLAKDHSDNRKALLEHLLSVIKDDGGTVLVYNVSFEKARLEEFAKYYPEYKDRLNNIINRLFDLFYITRNNTKLYEALGFPKEEASEINFYHEDLQGSYSIKYVLPIFTDLSYADMPVANGIDAMVAYNQYHLYSGNKLKSLQTDLINYCKQDTWAMVEILKGLRNI